MDEILSIFKNYLIGSYKFNSNLFTEANNGISFTINFVSNNKKFSGISISNSSIIYKRYKGSGTSSGDENTSTCRNTPASTPTYSPYYGGNTSTPICSSYSSSGDGNLDETTEDLIMDLYTFGEPYSIITFIEPVSQSSNKEFYDWFIVNTDPC